MKEDEEKAISIIRDYTYFEVNKSDHVVYLDNRDEFYPQFDEFLKGL